MPKTCDDTYRNERRIENASADRSNTTSYFYMRFRDVSLNRWPGVGEVVLSFPGRSSAVGSFAPPAARSTLFGFSPSSTWTSGENRGYGLGVE